MFQQEELTLKLYEDGQHYLKYIRRKDLSPALRMYIAHVALFDSGYGRITVLSQRYNISRNFIYHLRNHLLIYGWVMFGMHPVSTKIKTEEIDEKILLLREILVLRLEGKCPIIGISLLLKRRGLKGSSIGYISEVLKDIGSRLSPVLEVESDMKLAIVFASDEVYSSSQPLLITVDPVSSAILHMELGLDRKGETWEEHWQKLLAAGFTPILLTNDEGNGMKAAQGEVFKNIPRQTDTFHAIAHRLGDIRRILEQKAWSAIKEEYERETKTASAKSDGVFTQRFELYERAIEQSLSAIQLYEDFKLYYQFMIEQFQLFDEQGQLRNSTISRANLEDAISGMQALGHPKANKELKTIRNLMGNLFCFLDQAQAIVQQLQQTCITCEQQQALKAICRAYQYQKNYRKAKQANVKKYHQQKEEDWLIMAQIQWEQSQNQLMDFELFKKQCYQQLEGVVQSSAMVETINSIVRIYLNGCKNQISQAHLNLIMFYHNHRRYVQGKRKNHTPMELLTGQKQEEDWLDLLLKKVNIAA